MSKEYFEDCYVGDKAVSEGRTITETDVVLFAALSGDWHPLHTNAEYARDTQFGERIAHGSLTLIVSSGLLFRLGEELLPKRLAAAVGVERIRFVGPVKLGDTIYAESEICELTPMGSDRGMINIRFRVKNQRAESVLTGRLKMLAMRGPPEEKSG